MTEASLSNFDEYDDLLADDIKIRATHDMVNIFKGGEMSRSPRFMAYVDVHDPQTVNFGIETIDKNGERDPYFRQHRASELAARAIRHFELTQEVLGINFHWHMPIYDDERSDNYQQYVEARNLLLPSMSLEEARREAVYATWTIQKIAIPNGFREITQVSEKDGTLEAPGEVTGTIWKR